ncbi:hypothetical protein BGX27_001980 [Mortierella sp. AM989]|nr:hypothetical protein BGX27_001980 [Mortierella sp. AM989]
MVMTGQLSINYPSFYVTFTSLFHWSFLEFRESFAGDGPENSTVVLEYGGAGSVSQINGPRNGGSGGNLQKRLLSEPWSARDSLFLLASTESISLVELLPSMPTSSIDSHLLKRQDPSTSIQASTTEPPQSPPPSPSSVPPTSASGSSSAASTSGNSASSTSTKSTPRVTSSGVPSSSSTPTSSTPTTVPVIPIVTDPFSPQNSVAKHYNISKYGMEAYAAAIGAYPSNLFFCTFINTIMAGGASLFISAFLLVVAWFIAKESHQKGKTLQYAFNFVAGDTVMVAVASVSLLIFSVGATVLLTWRILRASARFLLFEDLGMLLKFGTLYNSLAEEGTLFFLVNLMARFLWGLSVAMLSSYGIAQISLLLAVELGYLLVIGFKWPYSESGDNKFHLLLGFVRIVVTGCSVAYLHDLNTSANIRQIFGYIQMALHLAVFIVMFALVLWNTIEVAFFWQSRHTSSWKGPTKTYSLEDPTQTNADWSIVSRPLGHVADPAQAGPIKSRRYTVQPYSSIGDLNTFSKDSLIGRRSLYHQSHPPPGYRRSRFLTEGEPTLDLRPEIMVPSSSSPGPMSSRSANSLPRSPSADSIEGPAIPLQPTQLSLVRFQPPRESYAKIQRMTLQQATTPDLRTRRMSDIFRDGGYLYEPSETIKTTTANVPKDKPSVFKSIKESIGSILSINKRTNKRSTGDGSKPKAFEVIRPQRLPPVTDTADDNSQAGDDNLRELNSVGISRFFEESGLNNERKRSLFVANPEVVISRTGSVRSSISGVLQAKPDLIRQISSATSVHSVSRQRSALNMSSDLNSIYSGVGSDSDNVDIKRVSTTSVQHIYPRASVESNIAEVLRSETPFKLQGGGIIKVSQGPEKAVQYWRKESGQYVESTSTDPLAERKQNAVLPHVSPPLLLLPTTRGSFFDTIQVDTSKVAVTAPSIKSRAGSRPESPTESHHSVNVAASAGKMHEILDRMFSDQDDDDSDAISDGEESCSTFSGRVSATIIALQQKREQEEYFADAQSVYRSETLEPVLEHHDSGDESGNGDDGTASVWKVPFKPTRTPSGTLIRTYSGSSKLASTSAPTSSATLLHPSKSGSLGRPLAQTPLHSPPVQSFSGSTTSLLLPGSLSRQSSRTSLGGGPILPKQEHEVNATQLGGVHDTKVTDPLQEEPVATSKIHTNNETS